MQNTSNGLHKLSMMALIVALMTSGCAWVKLTPEGGGVRVADASEVLNCKELGITRVSLIDKVAGIKRDAQKVQNELEMLARNSAARMNGNAISPESPIVDGERVYTVYQCPQ